MLRIFFAVAIWLAPLAAASVQTNLLAPLAAASVQTNLSYSPITFSNATMLAAALPARRGRRYLRKKQVAERYGVDERTVDRMTKDGRLPPYTYLPGSKLPLQDEAELDARDDAAAAARSSNKSTMAETA